MPTWRQLPTKSTTQSGIALRHDADRSPHTNHKVGRRTALLTARPLQHCINNMVQRCARRKNLPDDLRRRIVPVARDTNKTMSEDIVRRGLGQPGPKLAVTVDGETGLPQVELGEVVTTDEVLSVIDED